MQPTDVAPRSSGNRLRGLMESCQASASDGHGVYSDDWGQQWPRTETRNLKVLQPGGHSKRMQSAAYWARRLGCRCQLSRQCCMDICWSPPRFGSPAGSLHGQARRQQQWQCA